MKKTTALAVIFAFALPMILVPSGVRANEGGPEGAVEHRLRPELFLGVAHEDGSDEFATGIGCEYRLTSLIGVGGFAERAGDEDVSWTFGLPVFVHPFKGARLLLAPGWEVREVRTLEEVKDDAKAEDGNARTKESEQSLLMRTGVAYEIEAGRWSITPEFNVDLIEGGHQVLVYGVSFGYVF